MCRKSIRSYGKCLQYCLACRTKRLTGTILRMRTCKPRSRVIAGMSCEKFLPAPKLYQSININTCLFCNVSSYKCCFSDVLFAQIKHWNDKVKMWICITTEQIAKPNMYCILFKIIGYLSCHHHSYATGDCAVTQLQCTIMHINFIIVVWQITQQRNIQTGWSQKMTSMFQWAYLSFDIVSLAKASA